MSKLWETEVKEQDVIKKFLAKECEKKNVRDEFFRYERCEISLRFDSERLVQVDLVRKSNNIET